LALVGDKFIYREAGLEDNTANRLLSSGWLYFGTSSADSGISFLLSGGLNITRGLRFVHSPVIRSSRTVKRWHRRFDSSSLVCLEALRPRYVVCWISGQYRVG